MDITVVLCTYNRCQMLAHALDSVAASRVPISVEWEVLVVDNNSSDQTHAVVEDFCRRYPGRFRYLKEPQQGLCYARNAGVREARGSVLAFMDDDVTVDPTWVWNLTSGLLGSEWAGAGGRIFPLWTCSIPNWLSTEGLHALAPFVAFDLGPEAGPLTQPPFGANMAFQKKMFEKFGGFRTDLDRCGSSMLGNGDTEFGRRLLTRGERLRYEPSAVVNHPVTKNRAQKKYVLAWEFGKGRGDIRELGVMSGTKWFASGIPLYLLRRIAVWMMRWMITITPSRRFSCKRSVWGLAGAIVECYEQSHHANKPGGSSVEVRRQGSVS
ncbi:MAG TPA: glycosyltransferase [Candidatus Acidoferrum sp.]|nr:glycosyltransferase [Candidatus Acidoferrum sp.]